MKNIKEIIRDYTAGKTTLEEANAALKAEGSGFYLDPEKNVIKPGEEGRFGLLDTGTGYLDKVEIADGRMLHNSGVGNMYALCCFQGKWYRVEGDRLGEEVTISHD